MENYQAFLKNLTHSELLKEANHVADTQGEKYSKENLLELVAALTDLCESVYFCESE